ncbi:hypothetical protein EXIGLDRAFT_690889 [Exidia glandulosa HHB12029]|uniref:Uncharacterized protein n=1 Tax=Exidia glandulosa HHB12029 TaxID=1314781 RepID=A0A165R0F8_EXIGL|nr:hypothetical protein EXIGLDRAFT_690889 [Exidia glandulosa HHB12029]
MNTSLPPSKVNDVRWGALLAASSSPGDGVSMRNTVQKFCEHINRVLKAHGKSHPPEHPSVRTSEVYVMGDVGRALDALASNLRRPDLIFVILPFDAECASGPAYVWADKHRTKVQTRVYLLDDLVKMDEDGIQGLVASLNLPQHRSLSDIDAEGQPTE